MNEYDHLGGLQRYQYRIDDMFAIHQDGISTGHERGRVAEASTTLALTSQSWNFEEMAN